MSLNLDTILESIVKYYNECTTPHKKIGGEFEIMAFFVKDNSRVSYYGKKGIESFLRYLVDIGYAKINETKRGKVLGLYTPYGDITLEPGAQLELASKACEDLHELSHSYKQHIQNISKHGEHFGYKWVAIGLDPIHSIDEISVIPKHRYWHMGDYLSQKGNLSLAMMRLTAATQVNLDYSSQENAISKLRSGLITSPFITAMFSNSAILNRKKSGYLSYRTHIWKNTDPERCGFIEDILTNRDFGFADYAKILVKLPLMYYFDQGKTLPAKGKNLLDLLQEKNKTIPDTEDIELSIQQLFTEVRLKKYIEFRGTDCTPPETCVALPAIWTGLMYDDNNREKIISLYSDIMTKENCIELWDRIAREGLKAQIKPDITVRDICIELLKLAEDGLKKRNKLNKQGKDERLYLVNLKKMINAGKTLADLALEKKNLLYKL